MAGRTVIVAVLTLCTMTLHAITYNYKPGVGISLSWGNDDVACVYTTDGDRIVMWVDGTSADKHTANLNGYGWALASDNDYCCYYPYNVEYVINGNSFKALPITYNNQTQHGNASTEHLATYDYMAGQSTSSSSDCNFDLQHLGAVIRIDYTMSETAEVQSVTLKSENDIFTVDATMNVTNNTVKATAKANSLVLGIDNTSISAGEQLVAYIMVNPAELSNETIDVIVKTANKTYTKRYTLSTVESGICYVLSDSNGSRAKANAINNMLASATGAIDKPTAYASDFPINEESVATAINTVASPSENQNNTYTLDGRQQSLSTIAKGTIYINNGKKHIR